MTMLSFRLGEPEVERARTWAARLGVDVSSLLRDALRRRLDELASVEDAEVWVASPLTADELALGAVSDWGPAEDWSAWAEERK